MQSWEQFLTLQERELGISTVRKWLRPLHVKDYDLCNLYLEARDSFQILWFEEHVRGKLSTSLLNAHRQPIAVHLSLASSDPSPPAKEKGKRAKKKVAEEPKTSPAFELFFDERDPHCTFHSLYVSEANLLAHKILVEAAGVPLTPDSTAHPSSQLAVFNPIYIYGQSGTGKTHLLMAAAQALSAAGVNVLYVRAETFTEHVVQAIRAGEMGAFRTTYRNRDVLIFDDVHLFSRKSSTQEEFFHTFNALHLAGKQIILSAQCSPQELQVVEPRLVSRFEWGLVLPLTLPAESEWIQLLKLKCSTLGLSFPRRVEELLCELFRSSPKALCAALEALVLRLHLEQGSSAKTQAALLHLTPRTVRELLTDLIVDEERVALKPEKIVHAVAEVYGIRTEDLFSKSQSREFVTPRQVAMFICRQNLNMSFTKIGDYFKRDHSTVISSIKRITKEIAELKSDLATDVSTILRKLVV